jgi:hypothetical protein
MYRPDHPPPHFHAQYGEYVAQIELGTWPNGLDPAPELLHGDYESATADGSRSQAARA